MGNQRMRARMTTIKQFREGLFDNHVCYFSSNTTRGGVKCMCSNTPTFCGIIKLKQKSKLKEHERLQEETLLGPNRKKQPRPQGVSNSTLSLIRPNTFITTLLYSRPQLEFLDSCSSQLHLKLSFFTCFTQSFSYTGFHSKSPYRKIKITMNI